MHLAESFPADASGWSAFARALTWTLVHSLWIGASLALLLYGSLRLAPVRRARLRYAASLSALFAVPLAAAWTLALELVRDCEEPLFQPVDLLAAGEAGRLAPVWAAANGLRALSCRGLAPAEPWIAGGWLLVSALALVRLAGGFAHLDRLASQDLVRANPALQARLARLARRLGLARSPGLYWSRRADVPMVVGAWRPRVVLPARLVGEALRGRLDLVLLHELGHVRRRDGLVHGAEAVLGTLFLCDPFWRWIRARVGREREHCCDDLALEGGADKLDYLRALARLEAQRAQRRRGGPMGCGAPRMAAASLFSSEGELLERVRRLSCAAPSLGGPALARAACGLVLGSAGLVFGAVPTRDAPVTVLEVEVAGSAGFEAAWLPEFGAWLPGDAALHAEAELAVPLGEARVVRGVLAAEGSAAADGDGEQRQFLIRIDAERNVFVARATSVSAALPLAGLPAGRAALRIRRVSSRR